MKLNLKCLQCKHTTPEGNLCYYSNPGVPIYCPFESWAQAKFYCKYYKGSELNDNL
jgi:hypothetical protein